MANKYTYINQTGGEGSIEANSPDQAIALAKDIAKSSGVQLVQPSPVAPVAPTVAPTPSAIPNPIPAPSTKVIGTPAPTLPVPTALDTNASYITTAAQDLANKRKTLEDTYKTSLADIEKQTTASQKKIDDLNALQQEGAINNIDTLSQPFRQTLEEQQRQKIYVNENFEANQKLTNELDSLLTEGNNLIAQEKGRPISTALLNSRVNKTISDVNARAGVIQAVMAARNGQISQAYTMIDRTANAITADRQDRLAYYKTLYDFYESKKDDEGKKLITLTSDKKKFLDAQIGLLENDLTQSTKNADYIKGLMTDPKTALTIAQAGVSLNDTPEQVNTKLAKQAYVEDRTKRIEDLTQKGYVFMATPHEAELHPSSQLVTVQDAKGNVMTFWNPPSKTTSGSGGNGTTPTTPVAKQTVNTILASVGLPLTAASADGGLTQSALNKAVAAGIPLNVAQGFWKNIVAGNTLEEIRTGLAEQTGNKETSYAYLDKFMAALQGKGSNSGEQNP